MKRIFIAINLPSELKEKLIKLQEELSQYLPNIKWTKPENIHLTLVFLGEIDSAKTQKVCQITKEATEDIEPFYLNLRGLGVFPEPRRAKILWLAVSGDSVLKDLNQTLFRKLTGNSFSLDERDFTPHITIGRGKDKRPNKEAVYFVLNKFKDADFGRLEVKSIEVMESQLKEEGPEYKIVNNLGFRR